MAGPSRRLWLPTGRVIDPGHFTRRVTKLGAYPFWLLSLALVWRGLRAGLLAGRDVVLDSSLLNAWSKGDPDADGSFPSSVHGYVVGYKVHVLLDRAARLPLFFLLSPANRNDLPFAYPLLWACRFLLTFCAILVVALVAHHWGRTDLRLSPTRVLAHSLPVQEAL